MSKINTRSYKLDWSFEKRLATEQLGKFKYTTATKALGELVANAFDAQASTVDITVKENKLGGIESITIEDDGYGISPDVLKRRFMSVGVEPNGNAAQFAKFGIGRFAVHRIGDKSHWKSVSLNENDTCISIEFDLDSDKNKKLKITEKKVINETPGTTIEIFNLYDKGKDALNNTRIAGVLLTEFCSFLLANPEKLIRIQSESLKVEDMISLRETETISPDNKIKEPFIINHLILNKSVDKARFPAQFIFTAKGRMVASAQPDEFSFPQYLCIVDSDYFNSIVSSNKAELIEMDDTFAYIKDAAFNKATEFAEKYRSHSGQRFIEKARTEEFYPFKDIPEESTTLVRQELYDVVLEKVNENVNIETMTRKQKAVVFKLLNRALDDENLFDVLNEVAKLSDDDVEKFRKVLEKTALTSIIKLSSEVTTRLMFVDILHQLVYGDVSKTLKERSQLHKMLEPHCWLFGPRFHLATSDDSFKKVLLEHRQKAGLKPINDDISNIDGINDIPDLFLYACKQYPQVPKHHHLIVEIKAPKVKVGNKETRQIRKYADIIRKSAEFDKFSTRWDLFLISSDISEEIEDDRNQKDKIPGCLWEWTDMTVWTFKWSEIIARSKEEMQLVRDNLKIKSEQLSISNYLKENFPDILSSLQGPSIKSS